MVPVVPTARAQSGVGQEVSPAVPFAVAAGPLRTYSEAWEYCTRMGMVLPDALQAEAIYEFSINSQGGTKLKNYDNNMTTGTFWTGLVLQKATRKKDKPVVACPVLFEILENQANDKNWRHTPWCEKDLSSKNILKRLSGESSRRMRKRALAVCVSPPTPIPNGEHL